MEISLAPSILFYVAGFPITNAIWVSWVVTLILVLSAWWVKNHLTEVPKGMQHFWEILLEGGYDFVLGVVGTESRAKKVFPFIATIFLFIFLSNMLSFVPGLGAITFNGSPIYRTATSDYNIVFALTIMSIIVVQFVTIITGGMIGYIKKFLNFNGPIDFFMGLMDIVGEGAKVISLSFRLFGNIFAGEVLAGVVYFLLPYIVPLPFAFLSLLGSVIQAAVFSILVLIFINMGIVERDAPAH